MGPSGLPAMIDKLARAPISQVVLFAIALTLVRVAIWPYLKNTPAHQRLGAYTFAKVVNEICDAVVYAGIVVFLLVRPFGVQTFYIPSGSMIDTLMLNDYIVANKLAYRIGDPKVGDIVVFKPPKSALFAHQGDTDFIKRLIGGPGDVVEWKGKKLYRNGKLIDEPYVDYTVNPNGPVMDPTLWGQVPQADFKLIKDGERYIVVQYTPSSVNEFNTDINVLEGDGALTSCADELVPKDEEEAKRWRELPAVAIPPGHYLFMGDNRNGSFDGRGWGLVPRSSIIAKSEFIWLPMARWGRTQ